MEHDEPETPAHPELEYEVIPADPECPMVEQDSSHNSRSDWKLYLSFIALIVTGSANVVTSKLQAIPM